jgi:hypothetical protein
MCALLICLFIFTYQNLYFVFQKKKKKKNPNILTNVNVDHFVKTAVFVDHGPWTYVLLAGLLIRWMILTVA